MSVDTFEGRRARVATPHADISYVDVGTGPTALFVHGVGTNALLWRNAIASVAGARRCIALDLPLHGESPARSDQDFTLGALADVVEEFCAALELRDVDLVAHDTGGAIAQIFAARHPERLHSFTLTNCDTHDNIPPEAFKPTVDLAKAGALAATAPALLADLSAARDVVFAMGYEHPDELSLEKVRSYLEPVAGTPEAAKHFENMLSRLEPTDLLAAEPALAKLEVPTLIVWGTADEFFDVKWAYFLRDLIPGATEVVEIPDAKLFFPDERGAELAAHLVRFWKSVDQASAA